ncbi:putative eka-like protein [Golovinomyces cichoracearum]|uniref:Putative eka-like protein n=1 Tax=Golovinomyces cichoracearum TaxID=62708 RepID=A0A420H781_9PEZI|nr:putative eka-like protein [Golovinomyces cichoracearum]
MKQKENQRFVEFYPLFDEILAGAGGDSWTEDSKLVWLRRSLSDSLKEQLTQTNLDPEDYYGSVRKIEEVAFRYEYTKQFKGKKDPENMQLTAPENYSRPLPNLDADGDVVMSRLDGRWRDYNKNKGQAKSNSEKDKVRLNNKSSTRYNRDEGKKHARFFGEAEMNRRKEKGLCLRCGTNTHFVSNCPYAPPKHKSEIKSAMIEITPQLEEDSDGSDGPEKD